MKKKLLPFILGCSMLAAFPIVAHAEDAPEVDSGNVTYGSFAEINDTDTGATDVVTAIPECTMTIPRDTTIKKGAISADIGRVTINGHYFVKPYYVEVSASRENFVKVNDSTGERIADRLANQDIIFDVATSTANTPATSGTAAANETFVQTGTLNIDGTDHITTYTNGNNNSEVGDRACRRFWKQESLSSNQDVAYKDGEVCDVNGQEHVWLRINPTQWTGTGTGDTLTYSKPEGGQYKGSITFTATFRDNYEDGMAEWAAYPIA